MRAKVTLFAGGIIGLHFQIVSVAGFPVTVAPIFVMIMLRCFVNFQLRASGIVFLCLTIAVAGLSATMSSATDPVQFARTLALVVFAAVAVLIATQGKLHATAPDWLAPGSFAALVVAASYSALQYLSGAAGSAALYNPWRGHQYLYQYSFAEQFGSIRAPGFYLEPSFNALVLGTLLFVCLMLNTRNMLSLAIATVGIACTRSLSGLAVLLLLAVVALVARGEEGNGRVIRRIFGLLGVTYVFWQFTGYIETRALSGRVAGTSTNYRLVAPLRIVRDVLTESPLGQPLGSVEHVLGSYGLLNGAKAGVSLDNGLYLLVFYFGWIAVCALVFGVIRLLMAARSARYSGGVLLGFLLLALVNTGGIFLPEFVLLTCLVLLVWRFQLRSVPEPLAQVELGNNRGERSGLSIGRHGDYGRPRRAPRDPGVA